MLYELILAISDYTFLFLGSVQQALFMLLQLLLGRIEWPS